MVVNDDAGHQVDRGDFKTIASRALLQGVLPYEPM